MKFFCACPKRRQRLRRYKSQPTHSLGSQIAIVSDLEAPTSQGTSIAGSASFKTNNKGTQHNAVAGSKRITSNTDGAIINPSNCGPAGPTQVTSENKKHEIDDLFDKLHSAKKEKKAELAALEHQRRQEEAKQAQKATGKKKQTKGLGYIVSPEAPLERIDKATGYPVYKAHLLKVGDGGGTPLCPFDCDCCF